MVDNLTLEIKIRTAIASVVQKNEDLWYNMIYNEDEEDSTKSERMLLHKVKRYLVKHYSLDVNDLNDNVIITMFENSEDEFSFFAYI